MSRTVKILEKLSVVLEGLETDLFKPNENKMCYNGVEFTHSEWKNLQVAIKKATYFYQKNNESSKKFQRKHREYTRLLRRITYYKNKPVKTERDFVRLELLQKQLEKHLDKMHNKKKEALKMRMLKEDIEYEKRKYEQSERVKNNDIQQIR